MTMTRRWTVGVVMSWLAAVSAGAQTSDRPDGMRFVPDVEAQFLALTERADALGFHLNGSPNPSSCKHYQALARVDAADGTPYFLVSRSGNTPPIPHLPDAASCDDSPDETGNGHLVVVRMNSRPNHGERLRSNRLRKGLASDLTPPRTPDKAVAYFTVVGGDPRDPDPAGRPGLVPGDDVGSRSPRVYQHPGGMALVGHMLAIALESPRDEGAVPLTQIMFFDVSNPELPVFKSQFTPINGAGEVRPSAGVVAVTPLPGGRYLMMTTGGAHNTTWYFYRSTLTDLSSPDLAWDLVGHVPSPFEDPDDTDAHQTLTFLRHGNIDGPLYLAGARGHAIFADHDRIDLFYVAYQPPESAGGESVALLPGGLIGKRITPLPHSGGVLALANLAAASAFHVTPSGELIFYATEHDNDGPGGTVNMGEWRHIEVVRDGSPTLLPTALMDGPFEVDEGRSVSVTGSAGPPATRAFLQVFADLAFRGHSVVGDIDDIPFEDFDHLNEFARSWNWYAPKGCTAFAVDRHRPAAKTLLGRGEIGRDPDLREVLSDDGTTHMDQKIDEVGFDTIDCDRYYAGPFVLRWDLDVDGSFETTGTSVTFDARAFDGPSVVSVPALAQDAANGPAGQAAARVTVRNVAPSLTTFRITDGAANQVNVDVPFVLTNLPVTVSAGFSDPGVLDHQTASLAWGDGQVDAGTAFTTFEEAFGDGTGAIVHTRAYAVPGSYTLALSVRDDDGGDDGESAVVRVVTPEQAVLEIIGLIDQAIANAASPGVRQSLDKARKALAGSNSDSHNGALAKIHGGQTQAAIAFLRQAITWSERAAADGADTAALVALLQQVVAALS